MQGSESPRAQGDASPEYRRVAGAGGRRVWEAGRETCECPGRAEAAHEPECDAAWLDGNMGASLATSGRTVVKKESCRCGAERYGKDCEVCRRSWDDPKPFDRAVARWVDMGEPDDITYRRRFGCPCVCHKGDELVAAVRPTGAARAGLERPLPFVTFYGLAAFALGLAAAARRAPCFCPGVPPSILKASLAAAGDAAPEAPFEDPFADEREALDRATNDERARDALACAARRSRAALSGLGAPPIADALTTFERRRRPHVLPPLEPIQAPEGPPRPAGQVIRFCTCDCHVERDACACACHAPECCMTADGRQKHETRSLVIAGCTCKEHEAVACSAQRHQAKKGGCLCPKPGPGIRRPRQQPKTAENKARKGCAVLMPPIPSIPDPCRCGCHVSGCCTVAGSSERRDHGSRGTLFGACPCQDHDAQTCAVRFLGPRVLATKVDTLHLSWHLSFDPALLDFLRTKLKELREGRAQDVVVKLPGDDTPWKLHKTGAGRFFSFRLSNEYADLLISSIRAQNAVQARFEVRAAFLWERELEGAWRWCAEIARRLHKGSTCARATVTRLDMAVDVTGVNFARALRDDFVMRARKRTRHSGRASAGDDCPSCRGSGVCGGCGGTGLLDENAAEAMIALDEHNSGLHVSGFSFGHGGIVARIYDKTREIREKAKDKKWLYLCWATRGWVGSETVWRVEIQIRREVLVELVGREEADFVSLDGKKKPSLERKLRGTGLVLRDDGTVKAGETKDGLVELVAARSRSGLALDTLEGCRHAIGAMWAYAVGGKRGHTAWVKWCVPDPDDARRARWDARPEWKIVQGAAWGRAEPFELIRVRVKDAKFQTLLPQWVGITRAMAAVAGKARALKGGEEMSLADYERAYLAAMKGEPVPGAVEYEPTATDFEPHLGRYTKRRRKAEGCDVSDLGVAWAEWVNEARVERGLEGAVYATEEERAKGRAIERERRAAKRAKQLAMSV